jgi:hypothetical protein
LLEERVNSAAVNGGQFSVIKPSDGESDTAATLSGLGYARPNGNNNTTLGIYQKIQKHDTETELSMLRPVPSDREQTGLREKYKSLIRQLPSKPYIDKLLATYFHEVNYQYFALDEGVFRDLLQDWHNLPFATLNKGPSELPPDLQFFPALLFQCLALALQYQPLDHDPSLDALKYAGGMSFDDLASDYSDSSLSILNLLGKRQTTLITVQAGFLRTTYLKSVGMITESWHSLSSTIRDAQEIGLHRDVVKTRKPDEKPEDILDGLWHEQLRRRVWLILSLWDIHMAVVLGRPTTIDPRDGKPSFPIDAPIPKNRREAAPVARSKSDPPTPLTMLLWSTEINAPLWDIFNLEKEDPNQNNTAKVEKMHTLIQQIHHHCPPFFRAQNPDTSFDHLPECYWLPNSRNTFQGASAFTIMALHRPYIFTTSSSRTSALKAGLEVLRSQRTLFNNLSSLHYKMFSLVLNTFDAIVLVAALFILHPYENREYLDDTLQHFEWGMERFQTMSERNSMAKSALGVLKAIHVRLNKALKSQKGAAKAIPSPSTSATPEAYPNNQFAPPAPMTSSTASTKSDGTPGHYNVPSIANLTSPLDSSQSSSIPSSTTTPGWDMNPQNFDFSNMAPLHPIHDLIYNDLGTGMDDMNSSAYQTGTWDMNSLGIGAGMGAVGPVANAPWQFAGDFGSDSFWGVMNSYQP